MRLFKEKGLNRHLFALLLFLAIAITASCTRGGDNPQPSGGSAQVSDAEINSLTSDMQSAFGADNVNAVSSALGLAGIAVYTDDMAQSRAAVLPGARMLDAQARGMAMELSAGGGFTGAVLDSMAPPLPLEDGTLVPVSRLLAAYIAHGDTYGARQSRALMPGLDAAKHLDTQFPTITIVFFIKEFLVPLIAAAEDPDAVNMSLSAGAHAKVLRALDPCGAVSEFLDDLGDGVRDAVQNLIDPGRSSMFLSFVSNILGSVVDMTTDGVKRLLRHFPAVDAIRDIANVLGTATDMQSLFSQWTVTIAPPAGLHKVPGILGAGAFILTMDNGGDGFEWPQAVESCADLFDISLPRLDSADGSTVKWNKVSGFDDLGSSTGPQEGVIAGNQAAYSVVSATEGEEVHNGGGALDTGALAVRADVQMPGVEQLAKRIGSLLGSLAGDASLGKDAATVATKVAPHIGPSVPGVAQVEFHKPGKATADLDGPVMKLHAYSCNGLYGEWTGAFTEETPVGPISSTANWQFGADGTAHATHSISYDIEICHIDQQRTWSLVLTGAPDSPAIDGEINAAQSSITVTATGCPCTESWCPGSGAGTYGDQHLGIAPIIMGPNAECP